MYCLILKLINCIVFLDRISIAISKDGRFHLINCFIQLTAFTSVTAIFVLDMTIRAEDITW